MADIVVVETQPDPSVLIIWLHGLGADGHDFESIIGELRLENEKGIRFIFPNAPVRPVTINGGMRMRSWYDIAVSSDGFSTDEPQLRESAAYVEKLVEEALAWKKPPEKIFLAGFSQGGAVVLHAALRSKFLLSGVIALSTYLPFPDKVDAEMNSMQNGIDVFFAHGRNDPVIAIDRAITSKEKLAAIGLNVDWNVYEMEHAVCMEEILDLSRWLDSRL